MVNVQAIQTSLNINSTYVQIKAFQQPMAMFKSIAQQGRSQLDCAERTTTREHGNLTRTTLADFFNMPIHRNFSKLAIQPLGFFQDEIE